MAWAFLTGMHTALIPALRSAQEDSLGVRQAWATERMYQETKPGAGRKGSATVAGGLSLNPSIHKAAYNHV